MSTDKTDLNFEPRLSTAQEHFIEAVCTVMEDLETRLYNAACFKADDGKWYCRPDHKAFALHLSVRAVGWDFRDRYPKVWSRDARTLSEMAWDVFFVWRMGRRYLHKPASERVFWKEVMGEWGHEMDMWLFHPDFYFIDGVDEFDADPCLHPTWNWYTPSFKEEARWRRKVAKSKATASTKS